MDMKALAARLGKLQDKGSKGSWFKPNEEDQQVRILPYPHADGQMSFIEVFFHYDVAGHRSICCPEKTPGIEGSCPICKLADEFKNMGGKDNWYIFRALEAKLRTYSPVIVRGKEAEGVKLWGYGKTIYESLMETCIEEGDITSIDEGHDLTVKQIPAGAPGNDSTYPKPVCNVKFKPSSAFKTKKEAKDTVATIPNYLQDENIFKFLDYAALCDVVEKLNNEGTTTEETDYSALPSDENLTFGKDDTPAAPVASNDNLEAELDDLLS